MLFESTETPTVAQSLAELVRVLQARWRRFHLQVEQSAARQRQRRALGRLDERLLRDIGVSRQDAMREAAKPVWRV